MIDLLIWFWFIGKVIPIKCFYFFQNNLVSDNNKMRITWHRKIWIFLFYIKKNCDFYDKNVILHFHYCISFRNITFYILIKIEFFYQILHNLYTIDYTVKSFCKFINKLIEIFQWIMAIMIQFVANGVFNCWFAINCLVLITL